MKTEGSPFLQSFKGTMKLTSNGITGKDLYPNDNLGKF